jgi:predicted GNAT family acetyltransferase
MTTLIDSYYLYKKIDLTKQDHYIKFECVEGVITFYNTTKIKNNEIGIYLIYITEKLRKKGIFTNFIKHIIEDKHFDKIWIIEICSSSMIYFIENFKHKNMTFSNDIKGNAYLMNNYNLINNFNKN